MNKKMKKLEHLSQNTEFVYWIEGFLKSRIRALNFEKLWNAFEENRCSAPKSYEEFLERLDEI